MIVPLSGLSESAQHIKNKANITLPASLFTEKDWATCRRECRRILIAEPTNNAIRFLHASAGARSSLEITTDLESLIEDKKIPTSIRHAARIELANLLWKKKSITKAFEHFVTVFIETNSADMFKRSGCSLSIILKQNTELAKKNIYIQSQLKSSTSLWSTDLIAECSVNNESVQSAWSGKPAEWIISFYQSQISPAIGERCTLSPSCSEYAIHALKKHGALGLAIYADRAIREPDVIHKHKSPIVIDNRQKYRDTLNEHDYWMVDP